MFYHLGDSRHTRNIYINKVIGENEKCVYFMEKTILTSWPTQYFEAGVPNPHSVDLYLSVAC